METYMRIPPRAKKCRETIDQMVEWLHYYMSGTSEFKEFVRNDIQQLEEYLVEISQEHKVHNIRLASKLKAQWKSKEDK